MIFAFGNMTVSATDHESVRQMNMTESYKLCARIVTAAGR